MKLIIDNESDLGIVEIMSLVEKVIRMGRISNDNKQYCYCSTFTVLGNGYAVYSYLNKASDRLLIVNDANVFETVEV